jgi:hypothetical protein
MLFYAGLEILCGYFERLKNITRHKNREFYDLLI